MTKSIYNGGTTLFPGNVNAQNIAGSTVGGNTGDVTIGPIGAPSVQGAVLSGQQLSLTPANSSNPGVMTTAAQTFSGNKSFNDNIGIGKNNPQAKLDVAGDAIVSGIIKAQTIIANGNIAAQNVTGTTSGTNTGDVTISAPSASSATGATLTGQQLSLTPADANNPGILTTGAQTLAGNKTFTGGIGVTSGLAADSLNIGNIKSIAVSRPVFNSINALVVSNTAVSNPGPNSVQYNVIALVNGSYYGILTTVVDNVNHGATVNLNWSFGPTANNIASILIRRLKVVNGTTTVTYVTGSNSPITSFTDTVDWTVNYTATSNFNNAPLTASIKSSFLSNDAYTYVLNDLNVVGNIAIDGTVTSSNVSGKNTGDITIGTANGLALNGQQISLAAATGSTTGALTATDWTRLDSVSTNNTGTSSGTNTGDVTLGTFGPFSTPSGLILNGQQLCTAPANLVSPGVVTTDAQSFAGNKIFRDRIGINYSNPRAQLDVVGDIWVSGLTKTGTMAASGNITAANFTGTTTGTNTGDVTIGAPGNGLALNGQQLTLAAVTSSKSGALNAADFIRFNTTSNNTAGTNTGDVTLGPANGLALNGQQLSLGTASGSATGALTAADWTRFNTASNTAGTTTGNNTGDVTIGAVGASNANAATLVGQQLSLAPADVNNPGIMTTGAQTIAGKKTFATDTTTAGTLTCMTATILTNNPSTGITMSGPLINGTGTGCQFSMQSYPAAPRAYIINAVDTNGTCNVTHLINKGAGSTQYWMPLFLQAASGYVGINNTTPAYQLDVAGTSNFNGNMQVSGTGNFAGKLTASSGIGLPSTSGAALNYYDTQKINLNVQGTSSTTTITVTFTRVGNMVSAWVPSFNCTKDGNSDNIFVYLPAQYTSGFTNNSIVGYYNSPVSGPNAYNIRNGNLRMFNGNDGNFSASSSINVSGFVANYILE